MTELLGLFSNNLLPIFLAAGAGYLAAKFLNVAPRSISQIAFYIFSPCLVFYLITTSQLNNADITRMVGFATATILAVGALTALLGLLFKFQRSILLALMLTTMFGNAGNYGLSLNLFAFGEAALAQASLYFATVAILMYTLGVLIASLGKSNLKNSLFGLVKVPAIYALVLGILFNHFQWELPIPIDRTVTLLSNAAIPVLMVLMGIQLYNIKLGDHRFTLGLSNFLRLIVSPMIALSLNLVFHLQGAAYQAGITESAVPTAVVMTVLATEYDLEPSFVTSAVFTSTLLSPLTITPLLKFLGA